MDNYQRGFEKMKDDALAVSLLYVTGKRTEDELRAEMSARAPGVVDIFMKAAKQFEGLAKTDADLKAALEEYVELDARMDKKIHSTKNIFTRIAGLVANYDLVQQHKECEVKMRRIAFDSFAIRV